MTAQEQHAFYVSSRGEYGRLHLYPDCRFLRRAAVREATRHERRTLRLCSACEQRLSQEQAS